MRATVAKRIRREIYGADFSPRSRTYSVKWVKSWKRVPSPKDPDKFDMVKVDRPVLQAGGLRQRYQHRKKEEFK
mgnify:CR=1 FL=1